MSKLSMESKQPLPVNIFGFLQGVLAQFFDFYFILSFGVLPVKGNLRSYPQYLTWTIPAKGKKRTAEAPETLRSLSFL
jgi:hypothetical protein